ncbi:delta(3,5)-Delta(2,4)-dienoyl-CoA isomerase, mitochondrial-like [Convolutriloba macropyga]|uniref:delta(3,5)-Delta(2,4)-dienoyl-CoA isomerase, mitochondrial-like n=1 Tax=Convolutriloba macropyga TaxID=536237 RepID=UPI003F527F40
MRLSAKHFAETSAASFKHIILNSPSKYVYTVELNRPEKSNALNKELWSELGNCLRFLSSNEKCRSIVLSGKGKHFCAGIDLSDFVQNIAGAMATKSDVARRAFFAEQIVKKFQDDITALEQCNKPVIAAVHNGCIGAGLNLITACDMRYCTSDAWFQLKEVEIGIAADVGVLQRMPKIVANDSFMREISYTARKVTSDEALRHGLVSQVLTDRNTLLNEAICLAEKIAAKSPIAVQGTKKALVYARDHTVQDSLDQVRTWNLSMLQSEDVAKAAQASMSKGNTEAQFDDV